MKKWIKDKSKLLIGLTIVEGIISIITTLAFVYSDSLSYNDSLIFKSMGLQTLLETIYSSTWWALILLIFSFIVIFSITCLVYKKMEYQFISICMIVMLLILSINFNNSITQNLANAAIFIPIIILNIIAYKRQNELFKGKK